MEATIKKLEAIFGKDDPVLEWIQSQLENNRSIEQIEIDYKTFHILKELGG